MSRPAFIVVLLALVGLVLAMSWQHHRYVEARRHLVHDRQPLLHGAGVFHVLLHLELALGADLLEALRVLRDAVETDGEGLVVYVGKVAVNALTSSQLGDAFGTEVAWDAVVLLQLPSREAWDRLASSDRYRKAMEGFARRHPHGMQRSAWLNLAIPMGLLVEAVRQVVTWAPSHYPFVPARPEERALEGDGRLDALRAERALGRDAVVVANLLRVGTPEQQAADRATACGCSG